MRASATPARIATLLAGLVLAAAAPAAATPAAATPFERRLHAYAAEASSFLWNDSNKFLEDYHPLYVADDDPATAWVEGAKSSGAGEWLRIRVGWLDKTTQVRLRVRNGDQRSKDLWKANARAKAVTVRVLPGTTEEKVTLTDTDGWQEIVVDMPSGVLGAVELAIDSVYEGTRSADLGISDIQVFATSELSDSPQSEKDKLATLTSWKRARVTAMKQFTARQAELPIYPAYEVQQVGKPTSKWRYEDLLEEAAKDPGFAKEWKDALAGARALAQDLGSMTRARLAPASQTRLVEVYGTEILGFFSLAQHSGVPPREDVIRLPTLGLASAMFADQLRVADVQTGPTIAQYKQAKTCGADVAWVMRTQPKEGPGRVAAIAIGRCQRNRMRVGWYIATMIELMIYDPTGKLVLVAGSGNVEGYRWTMDGGKPMIASVRSMLPDGSILEARRPRSAAAP
jgi:hypothetical protein